MAKVQMFDRASLRAEIERLKTENAALKQEIIETRTKSADGVLLQRLATQEKEIHAHYQRMIDEFWAGCQKINERSKAELAALGIKL